MMNTITGMFVKGGHMSGYHFLWKLSILAFGIFWLVMLFNCLQRKFKTDVDKIAWILVLVFIPVVGAFLYLFSLHYKLKKKKK
jgi:nitric oxide reductase large subunit